MIEFQDVSSSYPDSADGGLKNISLTIPDGQCVLLCGRSGCGKTTLTRLINGLIPQFFAGELSGKVLLNGESLAELPMYRIAEKVGSVFQNPRTQFFNVDTDSEIAFGMENEAVPQERMERCVAETARALRIENLIISKSSFICFSTHSLLHFISTILPVNVFIHGIISDASYTSAVNL